MGYFCIFFFPENSYVNTGLLYNTHSWLPMHIRIELLQNGEVKIKKILPADMESPDEVSIKEDYCKFVSLHGVIYSSIGGDVERSGKGW